jgi:carbonic anhydrase/acetyltransferase-like protein (isoleucine patch superfamily)
MRLHAAKPGPELELADSEIHASVLVAGTSRLGGRIVAAADSSIWFGCELDANGGEIIIGRNANIQDNTWIHCRPGRRFAIGADSTIGHNVTLGDCTIGARALIGIGSVVANGTVIGDDVFLAAGAETTEGQVLESGFLWGKRPAVKMAPLDAAKRELIALTVVHYCGYARAFADAQRS